MLSQSFFAMENSKDWMEPHVYNGHGPKEVGNTECPDILKYSNFHMEIF